MTIARNIEAQAERLRIATTAEDLTAGERVSLQYCGALSTIVASTLCEVLAQAKESEMFALDKANRVLREWGADELLD